MAGRPRAPIGQGRHFGRTAQLKPPASLAVSSFLSTLKKQGSREHACFMTDWFVSFSIISPLHLFSCVRERLTHLLGKR